MGKLADLLTGVRVLETRKSEFNGKVEVISDLAWGVHIKAGGLTQSGGIAKKVWEKALREVKRVKGSKVERVLILGLGGGSISETIFEKWPGAKMAGVEIDSVMVSLGKKYLKLAQSDLEIKIEDANEYVKETPERFDLICVDVYVGGKVPEKLETVEFFEKVKDILKEDGVVVINRLYYGEKRKEAIKILEKLEKVFTNVKVVYPEANVMFICS